MPDAVVVVNAGSSSVKFSAFEVANGDLRAGVRGQIEGLYTSPRFTARSADGAAVAKKAWGDGTRLGHDGALDHLMAFLRDALHGDRLVGVGHRVVLLPMGTCCGAIDPGVLLYLMDERGMDARAIEKLRYSRSGLLGVSGISSDMRVLLGSDEPRAKLAVDLFLCRIRCELGSLAAALGGLDPLVFTAGIGKNAALIRERACQDAAWLGVELDAAANAARGPRISAAGAKAYAWVPPANEELMITRHTRRVLEAA